MEPGPLNTRRLLSFIFKIAQCVFALCGDGSEDHRTIRGGGGHNVWPWEWWGQIFRWLLRSLHNTLATLAWQTHWPLPQQAG